MVLESIIYPSCCGKTKHKFKYQMIFSFNSHSLYRLKETLGSGQFGEVYKATWSVGQDSLEIAVKTLKPGASEVDKVKFLQEAAIMGQFNHSNVIKMHGVVTLEEPVSLSCIFTLVMVL